MSAATMYGNRRDRGQLCAGFAAPHYAPINLAFEASRKRIFALLEGGVEHQSLLVVSSSLGQASSEKGPLKHCLVASFAEPLQSLQMFSCRQNRAGAVQVFHHLGTVVRICLVKDALSSILI